MSIHDDLNKHNQFKEETKLELDTKILWILIPLVIGGIISMFSNAHEDIQIIVWGVMVLISGFGIWTVNAKRIRKNRETLETQRWDNLDKRFDRVDDAFDKVDAELASLQKTDITLLRNELVSAHRRWYEERGYITLEALEFIDETYDEYHSKGGNSSGTRLWEDIHNLPIKEKRVHDNVE